jgi:hypothetical protein
VETMNRERRLLAGILFILAAVSSCLAQSSATGTLSGTVTDASGAVLPDTQITVSSGDTGSVRQTTTNSQGYFTVLQLPPGRYSLRARHEGFRSFEAPNITLLVGDKLPLSIELKVGSAAETVTVEGTQPLLETDSSSTGSTITPRQIETMPVNGRNYLDLLQLVPGVALNRTVDPNTDGATPILGERGGNTLFLIDGMNNSDQVNGGASAQFDQDSILEFQVLTAGYKAEFGHSSGGVVNVVSKSGTNDWHGGASLFHRNYELDSSNSDKVLGGSVPFLLRWDPSVQLGGPMVKDKMFFYGSAERISESRELNFQFPPNTPPFLINQEQAFDKHSKTQESRARLKFDQLLGHHHLAEQMNLTNSHVSDFLPLANPSLPSSRNDIGARHLMLGFTDTVTLGDQNNPWLLAFSGQYRGEPSSVAASHPEAGPPVFIVSLFSSLTTGTFFGDLGSIQFGPGHTPLVLDQNYGSYMASLGKQVGRQNWKFGGEFQRMIVNGTEASNQTSQLFSTVSDLQQFGPIGAGVYLLDNLGNPDPSLLKIKLRNSYTGLYAQNDWKLVKALTLNLGLRWDYDSEFPNKANFSPRVGFAWSVNPKTVVRGSFGMFYDHFRLGIGRDIPAFGGATVIDSFSVSLPRLLYGDPGIAPLTRRAARGLGTPCASPFLTDAEIAAQGATCPISLPDGTVPPLLGIDHLNNIVHAPGHAPVPANTVVNVGNVEQLSGLTPQEFADQASLAIGQQPGYFGYDVLGSLTSLAAGGSPLPAQVPVTVDPNFRTPYNRTYYLGAQRQLSDHWAVNLDLYHRDIKNILGARDSNLAFEARLPGHIGELVPGTGSTLIVSFGPWFSGYYNAMTVGVTKHLSQRFSFSANYTEARAVDNDLNASFSSDAQTAFGTRGLVVSQGPTDSFVGVVPLVTDSVTGQTNAKGSFLAGGSSPNEFGNFVPKAGIFYNGANLDKGPSELSIDHTFLLHGTVSLPWGMYFSSIFRAQSGQHYSANFFGDGSDTDGDNEFNGVDYTQGRGHFATPPYVNLDVRLAKEFSLGERFKLNAFFETFNLLNRANPAGVQSRENDPAVPNPPSPFGTVIQVLPGREVQVGLRVYF